MSNVNSILNERLKKGSQTSKMTALAKQSASGNLTSFSGIFSVTDLNDHEKGLLESILEEYKSNNADVKADLSSIILLTSEVKAINNQAAILHGERIKKAQTILKEYREGAFSAWLMAAYGNRQTPYNFLQYYEFCEAMPKTLRPQIEMMPRQAIYTLASREGAVSQKQKIIEDYKGETKQELLVLIRDTFPLDEQDKRRQNIGEAVIQHLRKALTSLNRAKRLTAEQKRTIKDLIQTLGSLLN